MNKTAIIIISIILVVGGIVSYNAFGNATVGDTQNSNVRDGIQYIMIYAKGGYSPRVSEAKSGIPTKLIIKTDGTYDCSLSLVIRSIDFRKVLAQTGEEVIDIGTPSAGQSLQGMCSMGMYSFTIKFN